MDSHHCKIKFWKKEKCVSVSVSIVALLKWPKRHGDMNLIGGGDPDLHRPWSDHIFGLCTVCECRAIFGFSKIGRLSHAILYYASSSLLLLTGNPWCLSNGCWVWCSRCSRAIGGILSFCFPYASSSFVLPIPTVRLQRPTTLFMTKNVDTSWPFDWQPLFQDQVLKEGKICFGRRPSSHCLARGCGNMNLIGSGGLDPHMAMEVQEFLNLAGLLTGTWYPLFPNEGYSLTVYHTSLHPLYW